MSEHWQISKAYYDELTAELAAARLRIMEAVEIFEMIRPLLGTGATLERVARWCSAANPQGEPK
jgi:hypothetical protein